MVYEVSIHLGCGNHPEDDRDEHASWAWMDIDESIHHYGQPVDKKMLDSLGNPAYRFEANGYIIGASSSAGRL